MDVNVMLHPPARHDSKMSPLYPKARVDFTDIVCWISNDPGLEQTKIGLARAVVIIGERMTVVQTLERRGVGGVKG
jgi:hypothetical protein